MPPTPLRGKGDGGGGGGGDEGRQDGYKLGSSENRMKRIAEREMDATKIS